MSVDLSALIPDLTLREYKPAGHPALSLYRRIWLGCCYGYRGRARKVWVNPEPRNGAPLLVSLLLETFHCNSDAAALIALARPGTDLINGFGELNVVVSERASDRATVLRWARDEVTFELRYVPAGRYALSAVAIGRDPGGTSTALDGPVAVTCNRIGGGAQPPTCPNGLWRYLWSLAVVIPFLIPGIFIPGMLAFALTSGAVPIMVVIASGLLTAYACTVWSARYAREHKRKVWSRVFAEGDYDGTIRRALASIGISLPDTASRPST